jgi:hypothetical protein
MIVVDYSIEDAREQTLKKFPSDRITQGIAHAIIRGDPDVYESPLIKISEAP